MTRFIAGSAVEAGCAIQSYAMNNAIGNESAPTLCDRALAKLGRSLPSIADPLRILPSKLPKGQ